MGKGIAKKIVFSVLTVLAVAGAVLILRDSAAHFEIYGQRLSVYTEKILLSGDEINDLEELEINLKKLPCLKFADLGTYRVYADDSAGFRAAFPGVEFRYGTYVQLYGVRFNTDAEVVDLSGVTVENTEELSRRLDDFTDLKKVSLGRENTVPAAEKAALCTAYPGIDFDIVATFDMYGMTVREDVTSLDLSGVGTDSSLSEKLSLLPSLTYVNMQGSEFSFEEQLALVRAHPGVEFDWDARLGGKVLNSMAETADISGIRVWDLDTLRCQLELFPRLTYLDMSNCGVSNEDMAALRDEYKDIKIVWRLYMGKWSLKTDAVAFSVLIYDYSHKRLTSSDIEVLKYCTDLQALDLGHQALTDLSVIGDYLPELRILILADNSISDLTPLAKLKHL
ncbi:MAG: hypothetical protein ACI3YE_07485, partial [Candidatus Avispirillum sp.]